ncbi:hypothetical protein PUNSTDRAFT_118734 [Punctularia strigosozonata HHB-11173 SS5]|uniref:uncharacterized protein n=1 Tax=Punctularia strigosozonata (strain HHB-11173) TaxID=741275 RepID=UPI0004416308|nr:uncharacterized protein PUNSTDRAFT_118734 [Punctularia strigosozonata HHB-11173 SS5]EIN11235.1 hypothetical protein PUNSTDRAFT_118734 [Punctularia strigosozonata HHB-11173 SS5]
MPESSTAIFKKVRVPKDRIPKVRRTDAPPPPDRAKTAPRREMPLQQQTDLVGVLNVALSSEKSRRGRDFSSRDEETKLYVDKERAIILSQASIARRVKDLRSTLVDKPPVVTSRKCFGHAFQCSDHDLLVYAKLSGGGQRPALFITREVNPTLPQNPGQFGLFVSKRVIDFTSVALFVPTPAGRSKPVSSQLWRYFGQYKCRKLDSLTVEEFEAQSTEVQRWWGQKLLRSRKYVEHIRCIARMYLRKCGRPTTTLNTVEAVQKIKSTKPGDPALVVLQDVLLSLKRGDEELDVIGLQFVEYDDNFASVVQSRMDSFASAEIQPSPRKAPKPKVPKASPPPLEKGPAEDTYASLFEGDLSDMSASEDEHT